MFFYCARDSGSFCQHVPGSSSQCAPCGACAVNMCAFVATIGGRAGIFFGLCVCGWLLWDRFATTSRLTSRGFAWRAPSRRQAKADE